MVLGKTGLKLNTGDKQDGYAMVKITIAHKISTLNLSSRNKANT